MSDPKGKKPEKQEGPARDEPYEAPRLTSVGNARDVLLGNAGSADDAGCGLQPTQVGG
jgi:hypothetical protein